MSDNTTQRKALRQLEDEPADERIAYYRKPFMVLWAAVQEASSELQDDYSLSPELSQLWVAERIRQVADSLVDRLAETAIAHGNPNRTWRARRAPAPRTHCVVSPAFVKAKGVSVRLSMRYWIRWNDKSPRYFEGSYHGSCDWA